MVLAEFAQNLSTAFQKLNKAIVVDEQELVAFIAEIKNSLLLADVNVTLVDSIIIKLHECGIKVPPKQRAKSIKFVLCEQMIKLFETPLYCPRWKQCNHLAMEVIVFIGLNGCGKTTTVAKYAHHYKHERKIGIICADTFRAGALDQLEQNIAKLNLPCYGNRHELDPAVVVSEGIRILKPQCDLILVDTSGRHQQDAVLFQEMVQIVKTIGSCEIVFVLDGSMGQSVMTQVEAFNHVVPIDSVIVSKMDGSRSKGGGAISAISVTKKPISFIGTGEKLEDLQLFDARRFIQRLLGMGDLSTMMELLRNQHTTKHMGLMRKMLTTEDNIKFSFRDLYEQLKMMNSLGSITSFISLLPGGAQLADKLAEQGDPTVKLRKFRIIMDSMSPYELDHDCTLFYKEPHRITRVAWGSGVSEGLVEELLGKFKPFQTTAMAFQKSKLAQVVREQKKFAPSSLMNGDLLKQKGDNNKIDFQSIFASVMKGVNTEDPTKKFKKL